MVTMLKAKANKKTNETEREEGGEKEELVTG